MVASLNDVGNKLRKTDGPTGANTISLIGIYTTSSAANIGDRQTGDQAVGSGTSVYFGYRREKSTDEDYAQTSPFDVVASSAPSDTDTTHGGVTNGTQFYRLSDWDGYKHWEGDSGGTREKLTGFTLDSSDCGSSNYPTHSSGCNPDDIDFSWTRPASSIDDNPDGQFQITVYVDDCPSNNPANCPEASSSVAQSGTPYTRKINNLTDTTTTINLDNMAEDTMFVITAVLEWDDRGDGAAGYNKHSEIATPNTPSGCTNCGIDTNSPTQLYFSTGLCKDCTNLGTMWFFDSGDDCEGVGCGILNGTDDTSTYSPDSTTQAGLGSGDCLYDNGSAGSTGTCTGPCQNLKSSSWVHVACDDQNTHGCGATEHALFRMSSGCLTSGRIACIVA